MTNRWTVRTKLTVLYGTLFLLAGAALLTITYFLLAQSLRDQGVDRTAVLAAPALRPEVTTSAGSAADQVTTMPTTVVSIQQAELDERWKLAEKLQEDFRSRTLTSLLQRGAIALAGVGLVGVWLSWLAARRTLRPLQQITATARRVADRNLHERIGLTGPHDELRRLADTFDDMLARLDGAFAAQRRFAANASHELRTPLAINRTLIEVALSRPHPSAEIRQLGETMLAVNARHEKLIDGLLLLARSDGAVLEPVPVDLADITARVAAGVDGSDVELVVDARPSPVHGDPVLLERMIQNLVRNAVAYNRKAGRVDVVCEPGRLTVTNTGPVIAAYEVPRLFEPFQRLTDRVGSAHGTGLGLSIVRSVSRAHGGDVTAEPGPHGGLAVTVTIPPGPS